jgi:hypothetical protein
VGALSEKTHSAVVRPNVIQTIGRIPLLVMPVAVELHVVGTRRTVTTVFRTCAKAALEQEQTSELRERQIQV